MKLHIFGAAGAGVTTLGQALSAEMDVPYFDSDDYFWAPAPAPFTERRPAAARDAALAQALADAPGWVLGGSLVGWGGSWRSAFDLAVFLWLPPALRLARLRQREHERYGDVIFTDPSRAAQFQHFLAWAANYDNHSAGGHRTLANHTAWLGQLQCPVLQLRDDWPVTQRVVRVAAKLRTLRLH